MCFVLSSVGACTDIMDMLHGGNLSAPAFHTLGSLFDSDVLVHKNLLVCVIYCWPLPLQLEPIL